MAGVSGYDYCKFLRQGTYSDFTIATNGVEFKVHKIVIAAASEFFRAVCGGRFQVRFLDILIFLPDALQEQHDGCVDLPEDSPEIIARMIVYLYTGKYHSAMTEEVSSLLRDQCPDKTSTTPVKSDVQLLNCMEADVLTYRCADKLNIQNLKTAASASFQVHFQKYLYSVDFGSKPLATIVGLVYESTSYDDTALRQYVTNHCIARHKAVQKSKELVQILEKNEYNAWSTGMHLQSRKKALQSELSTVKLELASAKQELVHQRKELGTAQD
jgi:hypothetical protein